MTDVIQEHIKSLEQRLATETQSPLFARLASYYLQAGRASDALRLCDDGLALYPFYSTAHLVKGKALVELGMIAEAKHEYEVVHELLPTNETLARLATSIDTGTSVEFGVARAEEVTPPPEVTATSSMMEEVVSEEPQHPTTEEIAQEELPIAEHTFAPTETALAPEPPAVQPETVEAPPFAEDSFGFQAPPSVEEEQTPPSGYETPGFGVEEPPQPVASDTGISATSEEPTAAPVAAEEEQVASIEEAPVTDYGFGVPEVAQPIAPMAEETPSVPEIAEPTASITSEDSFGVSIEAPAPPSVAEPTPVVEPPIALTPPVSESTAAEVPSAKEDQTPDWFEAFSQLQQPSAETTEAPPNAPAEEENPFAMFGAEQAPTAAESEPYEEFAARVRMELFGTEETMTLDQYLGSGPSAEPPAAPDQIGELAEKLKSSPRITPPVINYSEKAPRPATEGETSSGSGFVTPTLAEIYIKQGWFDDAIKAYRALVVNKPAEKEKFEQRIAEIEEMKKKQ
jgi:hypothetical protein